MKKEDVLLKFVESLNLCYWKVNEDGMFTYISPSSESFIGFTPEEMENKFHIYESFTIPDGSELNIRLPGVFLEKRCNKAFEVSCSHKGGETVSLEIQGQPVYDRNKKLAGYYGVLKDITEQKKNEKELIEFKTKADESENLKTIFLKNFSHEIRTPLNAIVGFSDFLADFELAEDKKRSYINIIQQCSQQLLSIVSDIINISAVEAGQITYLEQVTNIISVLEKLHKQFEPGPGDQKIEFQYRIIMDEDEAWVYTDEAKLLEIFSNLLKNAFKFTEEGRIEFGCSIKGECILFYCTDTGIGISPKYRSKIFQRFSQADTSSTRRYGGTGIGLALAKSYVELLGGELWFESSQGKGSEFYFTIPYKPVKTFSKDLKDKLYTKSMKKTIMVAEDDEFNFYLIKELLSHYGLKIVHAKNGNEVLELLKMNPAIELILMDIKMPLMDGFQATREVKQIRPDLPVIAQTAYASYADQLEVNNAGFDGYLSKPIKKEQLLSLVFKYLNYSNDKLEKNQATV